MKKNIKFFLLLLIITYGCQKDLGISKFPLAEDENIDTRKLENAYSKASSINGLGALIIERNELIVAEEYFGGYDQNTLFNIRSITKSITSILTGIAIEKGIINNEYQKFVDLIGDEIETVDPVKLNINLYQALTMSAGFYWNEWDYTNGFYNTYVLANDQLDFLYGQDIVDTPGEVFCYNSALPHLLSIIISQKSGLNTLNFAKENLFTPLGINTLDWYYFDNGYYNGGGDLLLKSADLIKIGRLMLNNGYYNNQMIVPSEWVIQSTTEKISTNNASPHGTAYGYWWWIGHAHNTTFYWGNGYGGQFLICIPSKNTVIVANSNHINTENTASGLWSKVENLIINDIIPCIN